MAITVVYVSLLLAAAAPTEKALAQAISGYEKGSYSAAAALPERTLSSGEMTKDEDAKARTESSTHAASSRRRG